MTTLDTLTKRNFDFAAHRFVAGLTMMPTSRTMVIGCVDPRVDPAHLLGLDPGEAIVIRNIGGRITPATLQTMGMLQTIAQVQGANPGDGFHLIVLHHTDCGITRLEGKPDMWLATLVSAKGNLKLKPSPFLEFQLLSMWPRSERTCQVVGLFLGLSMT